MQDVQNQKDLRGINIQCVGINNFSLPMLIRTKTGEAQKVLANIRFTVSLASEYKGTHMSRFVEILSAWQDKPLDKKELSALLEKALSRFKAQKAYVKLYFTYFIEQSSPVSKARSLLGIKTCFTGEKSLASKMEFTLGVEVPITSLCPCSKEIAAYGAHNQRSLIKAKVRYASDAITPAIEDLYKMLSTKASAPIFSLLKREDEKYVTELAYNQPKFVEDILRDSIIAMRSLKKDGLVWFSLTCENFESIHQHNAYATHEEYL